MQLGWWHVLRPDHLPRTPTILASLSRTPRPEGLAPTCTAMAKQPVPRAPFLVEWDGQNRMASLC